jgi:hypothetical protein
MLKQAEEHKLHDDFCKTADSIMADLTLAKSWMEQALGLGDPDSENYRRRSWSATLQVTKQCRVAGAMLRDCLQYAKELEQHRRLRAKSRLRRLR